MSDAFVAPPGCFRLEADWPDPHGRNPAHTSHPPLAGALVWAFLPSRDRIWSKPANGGFSRRPDELQLCPNPALTWRDIPDLLAFYLSGKAQLPNLKAADTAEALNRIAAGAGMAPWPGVAHVKLPDDRSSWGTWARVFLHTTQGGSYTGAGLLIAHRPSHTRFECGPIFSFALCDHRIVEGAGANHMHGWHPSSCTRCGLNTSVDSGD